VQPNASREPSSVSVITSNERIKFREFLKGEKKMTLQEAIERYPELLSQRVLERQLPDGTIQIVFKQAKVTGEWGSAPLGEYDEVVIKGRLFQTRCR